MFKKFFATILCVLIFSPVAFGQLIYGNTFPFWNVTNDLAVGGNTTLTGNTTIGGNLSVTGTSTLASGLALTSPTITTSLLTGSTSFTALAGATTLLTLGGTGASASTLFPSTLDSSTSITGAIRTSGGISAAKNIVVGAQFIVAATASPAAADACTAGRIVWDTGFIYVCTATGVWKRAAITGGY